jgi:hypothetical protein
MLTQATQCGAALDQVFLLTIFRDLNIGQSILPKIIPFPVVPFIIF